MLVIHNLQWSLGDVCTISTFQCNASEYAPIRGLPSFFLLPHQIYILNSFVKSVNALDFHLQQVELTVIWPF